MNIKKILLSLFVLVAVVVSTVGYSQAQTKSSILYVAPHRVVIGAGVKVETINVSNKSNEARRYDLQVIDQVMTEDGVTQRQDTFPYSAKRMLRFVPKRFTLQPGERQVVRVMARRTKDMASGDYHSHLLFREIPLKKKQVADLEKDRKEANTKGAASFEIRALYGLAVPIVVQQGALESDIKLTKIDVSKDEAGTSFLKVGFARTGNSEASGLLKTVYFAPGADPVEIATEQWVRMYREVDTITKTLKLNLSKGESLSGGKIVMTLTRGEGESAVVDTMEVMVP